MKEGPLAQRLPSYVPGRDFLSPARANSLKVPFSKKEALIKLGCLENLLEDEWIGDISKFKKQKEMVLQLLMLGAYSLPGLCLSSHKLDMHLKDVLHKEMEKCFADLRKGKIDIREKSGQITKLKCKSGLKFTVPCRSVDSILADYIRISQDYLPYCFFVTTKTLAFSTSHVTDKPMQTVRLNARNGSKTLKLVS